MVADPDVNFTEYGTNSVREIQPVADYTQFMANNGDAIGVVLACILVLCLILFVFFVGLKYVKKLIP